MPAMLTAERVGYLDSSSSALMKVVEIRPDDAAKEPGDRWGCETGHQMRCDLSLAPVKIPRGLGRSLHHWCGRELLAQEIHLRAWLTGVAGYRCPIGMTPVVKEAVAHRGASASTTSTRHQPVSSPTTRGELS